MLFVLIFPSALGLFITTPYGPAFARGPPEVEDRLRRILDRELFLGAYEVLMIPGYNIPALLFPTAEIQAWALHLGRLLRARLLPALRFPEHHETTLARLTYTINNYTSL